MHTHSEHRLLHFGPPEALNPDNAARLNETVPEPLTPEAQARAELERIDQLLKSGASNDQVAKEVKRLAEERGIVPVDLSDAPRTRLDQDNFSSYLHVLGPGLQQQLQDELGNRFGSLKVDLRLEENTAGLIRSGVTVRISYVDESSVLIQRHVEINAENLTKDLFANMNANFLIIEARPHDGSPTRKTAIRFGTIEDVVRAEFKLPPAPEPRVSLSGDRAVPDSLPPAIVPPGSPVNEQVGQNEKKVGIESRDLQPGDTRQETLQLPMLFKKNVERLNLSPDFQKTLTEQFANMPPMQQAQAIRALTAIKTENDAVLIGKLFQANQASFKAYGHDTGLRILARFPEDQIARIFDGENSIRGIKVNPPLTATDVRALISLIPSDSNSRDALERNVGQIRSFVQAYYPR